MEGFSKELALVEFLNAGLSGIRSVHYRTLKKYDGCRNADTGFNFLNAVAQLC
jgi:hypothetical protein